MPYERLYICSHPLWPYHRTSLGQYMYFLLKKVVILQFFSSTEKRIAMGTRSFGKKISIGKFPPTKISGMFSELWLLCTNMRKCSGVFSAYKCSESKLKWWNLWCWEVVESWKETGVHRCRGNQDIILCLFSLLKKFPSIIRPSRNNLTCWSSLLSTGCAAHYWINSKHSMTLMNILVYGDGMHEGRVQDLGKGIQNFQRMIFFNSLKYRFIPHSWVPTT